MYSYTNIKIHDTILQSNLIKKNSSFHSKSKMKYNSLCNKIDRFMIFYCDIMSLIKLILRYCICIICLM